jgi:hypothetical protein
MYRIIHRWLCIDTEICTNIDLERISFEEVFEFYVLNCILASGY